MTCTPTDNEENTLEWDARMLARFTTPDGASQARCNSAEGAIYPMGVAVAAMTTVLANVFVLHVPSPGLPSLFTDAQIHVAIYESVPWDDYPFPPRPADLDTNPEYAWWSVPGNVQVVGPKTAPEANQPLTFTPLDATLCLSLQVRGPGRLRVLINGKDIGRRLDDWMLTQGTFISFWEYRPSGFSLVPLDPLFASDPTGTTDPTPSPGSPVTVTIIPRDFRGPDWRITADPYSCSVG